MSKNKDRILRKIKKCLSLAESDNAHEAAQAIKQARALMTKHAIDMFEVESSTIDVLEVETKQKRPQKWQRILSTAIGEAFDCSTFSGYKRLIFIGPSPNPDICKYTYEVLVRQLEAHTKEFLNAQKADFAQYLAESGKSPTLKFSASISNSFTTKFRLGWCAGVASVIDQFASPISPDTTKQHEKIVTERLSTSIKEKKQPKKPKYSDAEASILAMGMKQGKTAQIHQAMNEKTDIKYIETQE